MIEMMKPDPMLQTAIIDFVLQSIIDGTAADMADVFDALRHASLIVSYTYCPRHTRRKSDFVLHPMSIKLMDVIRPSLVKIDLRVAIRTIDLVLEALIKIYTNGVTR